MRISITTAFIKIERLNQTSKPNKLESVLGMQTQLKGWFQVNFGKSATRPRKKEFIHRNTYKKYIHFILSYLVHFSILPNIPSGDSLRITGPNNSDISHTFQGFAA